MAPRPGRWRFCPGQSGALAYLPRNQRVAEAAARARPDAKVTGRAAVVPEGAAPGGAACRRGVRGYCTTDHTKVAVPETPSVSVAVTVTV